jgi:hypothetical protein
MYIRFNGSNTLLLCSLSVDLFALCITLGLICPVEMM